MKTTLLIMAAGLGSRYGGNKQIDRIGPNGEILMEYSIHDAVEAGFNKVVFVIRKSMADTFKEMIGDKIAKKVEVHYAFQEYDTLPDGFVPPADRKKPYGTVHAVVCAKSVIQEPFAVINADDYYGKDAFVAMAASLNRLRTAENQASMVAYYLKNTISKNGHVTRGICSTACPAIRIWPSMAGRNPATVRSNVDFPTPFGPTTARISPASKVKPTSRMIFFFP